MPDLAPITALGAAAPRSDRIGTLDITEGWDWALASIAFRKGRGTEAARRAAALIGAALPAPGVMTSNADWRAVWLAPESWLLAAPLAAHDDIAADVIAALGDAASITDQSDAWARFDIAADDAAGIAALLERLCNIDPQNLAPGRAICTVVEHLGVIVLREEAARLTILGTRSLAASLHHTLLTAARSLA